MKFGALGNRLGNFKAKTSSYDNRVYMLMSFGRRHVFIALSTLRRPDTAFYAAAALGAVGYR